LLYEKETCPGCEKGFEPGDDIVVCPVCGTPQHRECWLEHRECVNVALHADGYVWRAAGTPDEPKDHAGFDPKKDVGEVCANCGTNNPAGSITCAECEKSLGEEAKEAVEPAKPDPAPETPVAQPVAPRPAKVPPFLAGVSVDEVIGPVRALDIALYIQLGAKRYLSKFRKLERTGVKLGWSWAAFIFTPYWFFYRKLYWLGGIFLGLTLLTAVLFASPMLELQRIWAAMPKEGLGPADIINFQAQTQQFAPAIFGMFALSLANRCICALVAVPAYRKKVFADITSIKRFAKDENVFRALLIKRGGASGFALFGSVVVYDLLWYLITQTVKML
jgi:hypothetical protein